MEESTARGPKPNEFVIPEEQAYASTYLGAAHIAEFLLTELVPVDVETLDPHDRLCVVCHQEFQVFDPVKVAHTPVKMVCGHIFGRTCIMKWLDPLCYWVLPESGPRDPDEMVNELRKHGKTKCPTCRRVFFPEVFLEPMELLAARLWLWDYAYGYVGVARSAKEENSRKYLWRYLKHCRSIKDTEMYGESERTLLKGAQRFLLVFATGLKGQALTPIQEMLRENLERLAECDLSNLVPEVGGDSSLISRIMALESEPEPEP